MAGGTFVLGEKPLLPRRSLASQESCWQHKAKFLARSSFYIEYRYDRIGTDFPESEVILFG